MKRFYKILFAAIILFSYPLLKAEDDYRLWLRYDLIPDPRIPDQYNKSITGWMIEGESLMLRVAGDELQPGLNGLPDRNNPSVSAVKKRDHCCRNTGKLINC